MRGARRRQPKKLSVNERLISRVPLFAALPRGEIKLLAETLHMREFQQGELLFREGERGDRFYIVREGQIEIVKALGTSEQRRVGLRGPGHYIGEMSLLNREGLRTASARTHTPAQLLEMTGADFDALLSRQPSLAYEMVRELSRRLTEAHDTTIRDLREKNRQLSEAYEALKAAQAQIVEKEKLEHELHLARDVQASLMPRRIPSLPGWDFAAYWQPALEVGGDFYDFVPIPAPPTSAPALGLVIADVSGKGLSAALFMALARSVVRASVTGAATPAEYFTQANRLICADSPNSMFVTAFYAQLDPASGDITYVNAGHNPPLHYCADQESWAELKRTGLVLGLFDDVQMQQAVAHLNAGDFILLYTDGVTETINGQDEQFGRGRLQQVLLENRHRSAHEMVAAMAEALQRFSGGSTPFDDITAILAKRT